MTMTSRIIPSLVVAVGVLAAVALVYTLARQEFAGALLPFLVVCALAVVAPRALQGR